MQETDADCRFAAGGVARRGNAGLGVLRDVGVQLLEVIERLIVPHSWAKVASAV